MDILRGLVSMADFKFLNEILNLMALLGPLLSAMVDIVLILDSNVQASVVHRVFKVS